MALTFAVLFWSGNFVVGRALRDEVDPVTLNFARWLIALALLAPFVWRETVGSRAVLRREWRLVLGLGASGIAAFHTFVYIALQSTTATNALLTLSLAPIAILAGAALTGIERPGRHQLAGSLVSITGVAILVTRGDVAILHTAAFNTGDLWMLAAIATWAVYSLLLRRRPADLPQGAALLASIVAALALLAPFLAYGRGPKLEALASVPVVLGIAYVAVFASAIAFLQWSYGVSRLGAGRAGQFVQLMPVFGAALAMLLLGEEPTLAQIAGAALVLSGVAVVGRRP